MKTKKYKIISVTNNDHQGLRGNEELQSCLNDGWAIDKLSPNRYDEKRYSGTLSCGDIAMSTAVWLVVLVKNLDLSDR